MQQPPNDQPWQQPQQPNTQYPSQQPPPPPQWQPQYPPPPNTYYPPGQWQQPPMMPPPRPPRKRGNPWLILGIIAAVLIIGGAIINAATPSHTDVTATPTTDIVQATDTPVATATLDQSVPTDTPAPTTAPAKWTTTHSFTGSGIKKTAIFSVPDDWKIIWSCNAGSFYGNQYNVQVYVYNSDGSIADVAINELCKTGNTSGETEEHQSGDVYLT